MKKEYAVYIDYKAAAPKSTDIHELDGETLIEAMCEAERYFTDDVYLIVRAAYRHRFAVARYPCIWNTVSVADFDYCVPCIISKVGVESHSRLAYNPVLSLIFLFRVIGESAIVIRCSSGQAGVGVGQCRAFVNNCAVVDARRRRAGLAHDASADKAVVLIGAGRCPR